MSKYKYYFKKPKGEIVKDMLLGLAIGGTVLLAASSPDFGVNLIRSFSREKNYRPKRAYDTFYRLRKEGCIEVQKRNQQIYIRLTEKGRRRAGIYQINSLTLHKPKRWDGLWRIAIFDIKEKQRIKREALRGLLKRLEFYPLQRSVWVSPYECRDEVQLLKDFFGFRDDELKLIVTRDIENDSKMKKHFSFP
jgi:DNA-binding PadR family transcriptional regulator